MSVMRPNTQLNWLARYVPILELLDDQAKASLLEVGAGHRGLGSVIETNFVGVDVGFSQPCERPMMPVQYSGGRLPFADGSFDTAVSLDVFEHVPPRQRDAFIAELVRVTARRVIIAFPCDEAGAHADAALATMVERLSMARPTWLKEHERYGLPESQRFEAQLNRLSGWRWRTMPAANALSCLLLTVADVVPELSAFVAPLLEGHGDGVRALIEASRFGPAFRKVYVIEKERLHKAKVSTSSPEHFLKALCCPRCGEALAVEAAHQRADCRRCSAHFQREPRGVWNLQLAPDDPALAPPPRLWLEPNWVQSTDWVVAVHNYLKAFEPSERSTLYLKVPAPLTADEALAFIAPVLEPYGERPFAEVSLIDDPNERPPEPTLSIPMAGASSCTVAALRQLADGVPHRTKLETAEQQVIRAKRNKAIVDQVKLAQARRALKQAREAKPDLRTDNPLISVRISTFNRPQLLVERAIASVLAQSHQNFEIVIVGDHAVPETAEAVAKVNDPRIRYVNLPERPKYARFPRSFWSTAGTYAVNAALDLCRGEWVAPLDDDDEFAPHHLETLLQVAQSQQLEMVYSQMECFDGTGWRPLGKLPLKAGHICHGSVLYSARLLCLRYDPWAWLDEEPGDWNLWKRMVALGARVGFYPGCTGRHYPEYSSVDPDEKARLFARVATAEELLGDLEYTGAQHLLQMGGD